MPIEASVYPVDQPVESQDMSEIDEEAQASQGGPAAKPEPTLGVNMGVNVGLDVFRYKANTPLPPPPKKGNPLFPPPKDPTVPVKKAPAVFSPVKVQGVRSKVPYAGKKGLGIEH